MYREELDKIQRRERWQLIKGVVIGLLVAIAMGGLVLFLSSPGSSREVTGTIVDQQTDIGVPRGEASFWIKVQLENGKLVSVKITARTPARLGLRVTLDELTLWGGFKRYRFKFLHLEESDAEQQRQ